MKTFYYYSCLALAVGLFTGQANAQVPAIPAGSPPSAGDAAITAQINAAFDHDQLISGSRINVAAKNGVVTLSGITPTPQAKAEAAGVASRIAGVRLVQDGLEVGKIPAPKSGEGE